jgi:N-acetylneuraminate synthase
MAELKQLVEGVRFIDTVRAHPVDKNALAAEMKPLRALFTKSIVARSDLPGGTVLKPEHLALRKPGTGLSEEELPQILNRRLKEAVAANTLILEEHLE